MIVNYSNSQRAGVILYLTALIFGAYIQQIEKEQMARLKAKAKNGKLMLDE